MKKRSRFRGLLICAFCLAGLFGCAREPTPTPGYFLTFTPTPQPTKTAAEAAEDVKRMAEGNPTFLASQHLARGAECTDCHDPFPPTAVPPESACMSCHGGSEDKLAALKKGYQYHEPHFGQIACADCHTAHGPYQVKCLICHPACTLH